MNNSKIQLLDCTLRDGAYIVNSKFGTATVKGIIENLDNALVDIIECGWLKNDEHELGTSFFHKPYDLEKYITKKNNNITYVLMIDWDRYDLEYLPYCDGNSIDAIRVVFPYEHFCEGIEVGKKMIKKGYKVFYQAANTLSYPDSDLENLAKMVNESGAEGLSIVDTFGAMYFDDLIRISQILNSKLSKNIKLGFHSHNNQQLSFALSIVFMELMQSNERDCIVDSSLCGIGRGAGNTTTELLANYINKKYEGKYDMGIILDTIEDYIKDFKEKYEWGYSTSYFISGTFCTHVNNISYLKDKHNIKPKDMYKVLASMNASDRVKYDYGILENKYQEYIKEKDKR